MKFVAFPIPNKVIPLKQSTKIRSYFFFNAIKRDPVFASKFWLFVGSKIQIFSLWREKRDRHIEEKTKENECHTSSSSSFPSKKLPFCRFLQPFLRPFYSKAGGSKSHGGMKSGIYSSVWQGLAMLTFVPLKFIKAPRLLPRRRPRGLCQVVVVAFPPCLHGAG